MPINPTTPSATHTAMIFPLRVVGIEKPPVFLIRPVVREGILRVVAAPMRWVAGRMLCVARPLVGCAAGTRPVEPDFAGAVAGTAAMRAVVGTAAAGIARVVVLRSVVGAGAGTRPVEPLL